VELFLSERPKTSIPQPLLPNGPLRQSAGPKRMDPPGRAESAGFDVLITYDAAVRGCFRDYLSIHQVDVSAATVVERIRGVRSFDAPRAAEPAGSN
jgi:hypothetical protein